MVERLCKYLLWDYYTTAAVQDQYKTYINAIVSKYKTSTVDFAWELANEPAAMAVQPQSSRIGRLQPVYISRV